MDFGTQFLKVRVVTQGSAFWGPHDGRQQCGVQILPKPSKWPSIGTLELPRTVVCTIWFQRNELCVTDFDISSNSIYQQQELHVLVTVSLLMDLTITYRPKYQSPILAMI